jgi:hypothetical protein
MSRWMLRRHTLIAVIFAALPASHTLLGRGPAFTMYASMLEFRLELRGQERDGTSKRLYPSLLGEALPPSARPFVIGSEQFRRVADVAVLRAHLDDLGRLACSKSPSLSEVELHLVERSDGHETRTSRRVTCEP